MIGALGIVHQLINWILGTFQLDGECMSDLDINTEIACLTKRLAQKNEDITKPRQSTCERSTLSPNQITALGS